MSKKAWIIFAAACVVLLGWLIYVSSKDKVDVSKVNANKFIKASAQSGNIGDHVFGKKDSKVLFIEYGDFQCPGCASVYPTIKAVTEKYKDQVAFIFRNFPLTNIHPNAKAAAAAAEAAGLQNKYWEMYDALYSDQNAWKDLSPNKRIDYFSLHARNFGLDVDRFKEDMASGEINRKITFDLAVGKKVGISATPTFYLDGELIKQDTWNDQKKLGQAIEDVLKDHNIDLPKEK